MGRAIVLVIDAMGSTTFDERLAASNRAWGFPNLGKFGYGQMVSDEHKNVFGNREETSLFNIVTPLSFWPDSGIGHPEMVGYVNPTNYNLFLDGMPQDYVSELERRTGRRLIFNKRSGGGEALAAGHSEVMEIYQKTGIAPVIGYTSACDPIFQFGIFEDLFDMANGEHTQYIRAAFDLAMEKGILISRAISRPYIAKPEGKLERTSNRTEVMAPIDQVTLIDILNQEGIATVGIGKVIDIIPRLRHIYKVKPDEVMDPYLLAALGQDSSTKNPLSLQALANALHDPALGKNSAIIVNCDDADSKFGHPMDGNGMLSSVSVIDGYIPHILRMMEKGDMLVITADHGMEFKTVSGIEYGYHRKEPLPVAYNIKGQKPYMMIRGDMGLGAVGHLLAGYFSEGLSSRYIETCFSQLTH